MAMIDLPPGSGLPAWVWHGYEVVAAIVIAVLIGSSISGVVARLVRGRSRGHRLHAIVVAGAIMLFAGWVAASALASIDPPDGKFCYAPAAWVDEPPETCVSHRPVWLLAAPLAVALVLAGAGLALAMPSRRRWTALCLFGLLVAAAVLEIDAQLALVQPGVFESGGIMSIRDALVRLLQDPINAGLGLAVIATLVIGRFVCRADKSNSPELPTAKAPP